MADVIKQPDSKTLGLYFLKQSILLESYGRNCFIKTLGSA